jgi:hypothetical protein
METGPAANNEKRGFVRSLVIFRFYFFAGFFFFPLVDLGTVLASNYNYNRFSFKFCDKW